MLHIAYGGCVITCDDAEEIRQWKALASEFERTTLPHGDLPSSIKNLKITGADLSQFKDRELSRLTTLDCSKDLPLHIIHSLTSLTHLTLRDSYNTTVAINDRLTALPPLMSLRVIGWRKYLQLDTILTHHGLSLRELALHEFEQSELFTRRGVLRINELLHIRDSCPCLEGLSIDLNIPEYPLPKSNHLSTDTHQDVYNALSSFPFLQRLQLNFNLGIASFNKSQTHSLSPDGHRQLIPLADESFVIRLLAAVNLGRTASLAIRELRVAQGEAQRATGHGYPVSWVIWEQSTHHWLKATRSKRDDEPDRIVISKFRDTPDFADDIWRDSQFYT